MTDNGASAGDKLIRWQKAIERASVENVRYFALVAMKDQYDALCKLEGLRDHADDEVRLAARSACATINDIYLAFNLYVTCNGKD